MIRINNSFLTCNVTRLKHPPSQYSPHVGLHVGLFGTGFNDVRSLRAQQVLTDPLVLDQNHVSERPNRSGLHLRARAQFDMFVTE